MNKKPIEQISEILKDIKENLRKKYGVENIGLFGSYVRGEQGKNSDVDILVEFSPKVKISLLEFVELENYLCDLLGVKVDLGEKQALKPRIGKHILKETVYL